MAPAVRQTLEDLYACTKTRLPSRQVMDEFRNLILPALISCLIRPSQAQARLTPNLSDVGFAVNPVGEERLLGTPYLDRLYQEGREFLYRVRPIPGKAVSSVVIGLGVPEKRFETCRFSSWASRTPPTQSGPHNIRRVPASVAAMVPIWWKVSRSRKPLRPANSPMRSAAGPCGRGGGTCWCRPVRNMAHTNGVESFWAMLRTYSPAEWLTASCW